MRTAVGPMRKSAVVLRLAYRTADRDQHPSRSMSSCAELRLSSDDHDRGDAELQTVVNSTSKCDERDANHALRSARSRPYEGELKLPRAPTEASEV
jgi:hypothetical protein